MIIGFILTHSIDFNLALRILSFYLIFSLLWFISSFIVYYWFPYINILFFFLFLFLFFLFSFPTLCLSFVSFLFILFWIRFRCVNDINRLRFLTHKKLVRVSMGIFFLIFFNELSSFLFKNLIKFLSSCFSLFNFILWVFMIWVLYFLIWFIRFWLL